MSSNGYSGNRCAGNASGGGAVVIKVVSGNDYSGARPHPMPDVKLDPPKRVRECRLPECRKESGAYSEGYCPDHWSNLLSWTQRRTA